MSRNGLVLILGLAVTALVSGESFDFVLNDPGEHDYGLQLELPPTFGEGEFTLELWIRPDASFPIGPTCCGAAQLINWSDADEEPYSSCCWWFDGNFLLDGHNNGSFHDGTFSLQFYGGGRVRWLFGDGTVAGPGGHWSVGAYPASTTDSLLDGEWHQLTLVRRWIGVTAAQLELWVDGELVADEISPVRTDLRFWWDDWAGFPAPQAGWFWGAEKQAAIGVLSQYEDYKGLIDELRFWDRAKTPGEIQTSYAAPVGGTEPGLVGVFAFEEGTGPVACDSTAPPRCIEWFLTEESAWTAEGAPLGGPPAGDPFIRGDFNCDDSVNIADAISILSFLFTLGPASCCPASGDVQDDGSVDLGDAVSLLDYIFSGGPSPPPPFPACGADGCPAYVCP